MGTQFSLRLPSEVARDGGRHRRHHPPLSLRLEHIDARCDRSRGPGRHRARPSRDREPTAPEEHPLHAVRPAAGPRGPPRVPPCIPRRSPPATRPPFHASGDSDRPGRRRHANHPWDYDVRRIDGRIPPERNRVRPRRGCPSAPGYGDARGHGGNPDRCDGRLRTGDFGGRRRVHRGPSYRRTDPGPYDDDHHGHRAGRIRPCNRCRDHPPRDRGARVLALVPAPGEDTPMTMSVEVEALRKSSGRRNVLVDVALHTPPGEILAVIGPNGAGKTTLLRIVDFLLRPDAGAVRYDGRDGPADPDARLGLRRRISMARRKPRVFWGAVFFSVSYGLCVRGVEPPELPIRTLQALEAVGLVDRLHAGTTVILVPHDMFQAKRLANRVALLYEGRIIESGSVIEFFDEPGDPRTRAFVRGELP